MTIDLVYLQTHYSMNPNPLKGRKLFERFRVDSEHCRLGHIVRETKETWAPQFADDVVTYAELDEFAPDLIFLEGGLLDDDAWRIPEAVIGNHLGRGAVVVIADVDWNVLNRQHSHYERVLQFCGVTVAYDDNEPAVLYDPMSHYGGERQIVCRPADMAYESWLAPIYQDLPEFVVGNPVPMQAWMELVATCNRSTTRSESFIRSIFAGEPQSGAFAAARRMGRGYLVIITGNVSSDVWIDAFPGNIEWLVRLVTHLVERVRIDRRHNSMSWQVFVSHRHEDLTFANSFRDELHRRGFGSWFDTRQLITGDALTPEIQRAIDSSSHFALLWSAACVGAAWIRLELDHALAARKRIFLVRLDETPVPADVADKLRIEAQAISSQDAAKLVSMAIEREEKRRVAITTAMPAHPTPS